MKPPCEIIVREVLPALRATLARKLLKKGLTQMETAKCLGVTQGAISQYLRSMRGRENALCTNKEVDEKITKLADKVMGGAGSKKIMTEFCEICKLIRKKGLICQQHLNIYPSLKECKICL
ncbi:MAG: transcriptional regulator [Candidatus Aenigmarchaeota archaeon ex4484_14]|nr:MAG: transcriptional regulator [Candidatus Aenigmarchaeota archaeon ex4484_14]